MSVSSIYVHWPYCRSKCPYCGFFSLPCNSETSFEEMEECLLDELKFAIDTYDISNVKTIFFGGGTPTLMTVNAVSRIIDCVQKTCGLDDDNEITIEANPATFDREKLDSLKHAGVNRLSVGVQSFSSKNLKFLERIYDEKQAMSAAEMAAKTFDNFSFDFIYGYQGQTLEDLEKDLQLSVDFGCKHVSCYQLSFEENTPFFNRLQRGDILEIDENTQVKFYNFIEDFLKQYRIHRYEISNYAKLSFESKHNLVYWNYDEYLGIGPGAHSRICVDKERYEIVNMNVISDWMNSVKKRENKKGKCLTDVEQLEEIIIMGLRLTSGINIKLLRSKSKLVDDLLPRIEFLKKNNLVQSCSDTLKLTRDGALKLNSVIEYLLGGL